MGAHAGTHHGEGQTASNAAEHTGTQSHGPPDPLRSTYQRLEWYRTTTQRVLVAITVSLGLNVILVLVSIGLYWHTPTPDYFAVTSDMRVRHLKALTSPVMSNTALLGWATQALSETLSLDFVHWRQDLSKSQGSYTQAAFNSLIKSFKDSGNLNYIVDNRLSVSVVATQAPVLLNVGNIGGHKAWKMQVPLKLRYESSKGTPTTQTLVATMIIKRMSTLHYARGIAIAQVVLKHNNKPIG